MLLKPGLPSNYGRQHPIYTAQWAFPSEGLLVCDRAEFSSHLHDRAEFSSHLHAGENSSGEADVGVASSAVPRLR